MNNIFRSGYAIVFLVVMGCVHYSTYNEKPLQAVLINVVSVSKAHNIGYENDGQILNVEGYVIELNRQKSVNRSAVISDKNMENIHKDLLDVLLEDPENLSYLFIAIPEENIDILGIKRRNYLKDISINKKYNFKVMLFYSEELLKCGGFVIDYPKPINE